MSGVCKDCRPGRCVDAPTEAEPLLLRCTACDGEGCGECDGGHVAVTACPRRSVPLPVWHLLTAVDRLAKGMPPVTGGWLDQAECFMQGVDLVRSEEAYWEAKAWERKPGK